MKRIFFIFSCLLFSSIISLAQAVSVKVNYVPVAKKDTTQIGYIPGKKLQWSDYKIIILKDSSTISAITSSGFGYSVRMHSSEGITSFVFDVYCFFSKPTSWVKKGRTTDYVLNHEQKHFDISYINTLLFIKRLRQGTFTLENYRKELERNYKEAMNDMSAMQAAYDGETKNSIVKDKQAEWNNTISALVSKTEHEVLGI